MADDGRTRHRSGRRLLWASTVAYAGFVAYMSLRPFADSGLDRAIDRIGRGYFHLPAYAGLAVLLGLTLPRRSADRRRLLAAFSIATAYGWLLEVAQIPAPTRSFNVQGLAFDAIGAAVGVLAMLALDAAARTLRHRLSRRR